MAEKQELPWTTLARGHGARAASLADLADRARPAVVHVRGVAPDESAGRTRRCLRSRHAAPGHSGQ